MRNIIPVALLATAAMFSAPANAATITFADEGQTNLPVTAFDTALGTLTGVTITTGYSVYIDIVNGIPPDVEGYQQSYDVTGYFGYQPLGIARVDGTYAGFRLNPMYESILVSGSVTQTLSSATSDLSLFTQPNGLPIIAALNEGRVTNSNGAVVGIGDGGRPGAFNSAVSFSVTYEYIDAVPEPATWAMMLVGFAMVGATARYRRRKVAATFA